MKTKTYLIGALLCMAGLYGCGSSDSGSGGDTQSLPASSGGSSSPASSASSSSAADLSSVSAASSSAPAPIAYEETVQLDIAENTAIAEILQAPGELGWVYGLVLQSQDVGYFNIDGATGEITSTQPFDYENPQDNNSDNVYNLVVEASADGGNYARFTVAFTITNINELYAQMHFPPADSSLGGFATEVVTRGIVVDETGELADADEIQSILVNGAEAKIDGSNWSALVGSPRGESSVEVTIKNSNELSFESSYSFYNDPIASIPIYWTRSEGVTYAPAIGDAAILSFSDVDEVLVQPVDLSQQVCKHLSRIFVYPEAPYKLLSCNSIYPTGESSGTTLLSWFNDDAIQNITESKRFNFDAIVQIDRYVFWLEERRDTLFRFDLVNGMQDGFELPALPDNEGGVANPTHLMADGSNLFVKYNDDEWFSLFDGYMQPTEGLQPSTLTLAATTIPAEARFVDSILYVYEGDIDEAAELFFFDTEGQKYLLSGVGRGSGPTLTWTFNDRIVIGEYDDKQILACNKHSAGCILINKLSGDRVWYQRQVGYNSLEDINASLLITYDVNSDLYRFADVSNKSVGSYNPNTGWVDNLNVESELSEIWRGFAFSPGASTSFHLIEYSEYGRPYTDRPRLISYDPDTELKSSLITDNDLFLLFGESFDFFIPGDLEYSSVDNTLLFTYSRGNFNYFFDDVGRYRGIIKYFLDSGEALVIYEKEVEGSGFIPYGEITNVTSAGSFIYSVNSEPLTWLNASGDIISTFEVDLSPGAYIGSTIFDEKTNSFFYQMMDWFERSVSGIFQVPNIALEPEPEFLSVTELPNDIYALTFDTKRELLVHAQSRNWTVIDTSTGQKAFLGRAATELQATVQ